MKVQNFLDKMFETVFWNFEDLQWNFEKQALDFKFKVVVAFQTKNNFENSQMSVMESMAWIIEDFFEGKVANRASKDWIESSFNSFVHFEMEDCTLNTNLIELPFHISWYHAHNVMAQTDWDLLARKQGPVWKKRDQKATCTF